MTLPRRLTLAGDNELRMEPAGGIESLRYDHRQIGENDAARQRGGRAGGHRGQVDGADDRARPRGSANGRAERPPVARQGGAHRIAFYKDRGVALQAPAAQSGASLPRRLEVRESLLTLDSSYSSTLPGALSRPRRRPRCASTRASRCGFACSSTAASWRCSRTGSSASRFASIRDAGGQRRRLAAGSGIERPDDVPELLADAEHLRIAEQARGATPAEAGVQGGTGTGKRTDGRLPGGLSRP